MPVILQEYFQKNTGREYSVGFFTKLILVFKMIQNNKKITSGSGFLEHFAMATKILTIPKSTRGCIIECGAYKGGSTANLSLVASLCHRTLEVFDSFEGLPKPSDKDKAHVIIDQQEIHTYKKGAWFGSIEEVKKNITHYGVIDSCNFHVGYFNKSLPMFSKKCVFIFLDVDLESSLKTCLRYLWPLLQNGCYLFTHEAHHLQIASLFFDKKWWSKHLHCNPPGLIGAGSGLGLVPGQNAFKSDLGYTVKNPKISKFKIAPQSGM